MNATAQTKVDNTVDQILVKYFLDHIVNRIDWNQFATNDTSSLFGIERIQTTFLIFVNAGLVLLLIALSTACKYGRGRGRERQERGVTTSTTPTITKRGQGKPTDIGEPILTHFDIYVNSDDNNPESERPIEPNRDYPGSWGSDEFSDADYDDVPTTDIP